MSTREQRWRAIDAAVERVRPAVFRTITGDDVRRWLRMSRAWRNSVSDQIRERLGAAPRKF